ncbi:hypothetical protein DV737_g2009, partial [Chaetothyriales sp. CBS 132003]
MSRPVPVAVGRFFQLGWELMDGDVGASQETIKHLASDLGLSFVKDVADRHIPTANNTESRLPLWTSEVQPLFQLLTHSRVVDSAVLEQEVVMIYNFLIGVGGDRMVRLLSFVDNLVRAWPTSAAGQSRMAAVELSLTVLSKMLDCNTTTMLNPKLPILIKSFSESMDDESEDNFSRMQSTKYLEYIRQRLEVGNEIAGLQALPQVVAREAFVLRRDFPGTLSAEGRRHDNDHADISNIRILPTTEEIMSPRGEYLPTNNPSQWHIQGIRGRLDREFRLLREDTIGQLRDAVRRTLERIQKPSNKQDYHTRNILRTNDYDFPTLRRVEFDGSNGLQLVVSTLETQRRMHPSMAELIRSTLYPSLVDAEAVMNYPKVVGMKERLFWLHHEQLEAAAADHDPLNASHSNDFEIEMTVALVTHLVRQGQYTQGEIAVITPYLGQLHKLRRRMESMFEICLSDRDLDGLEAIYDSAGSPKSVQSAAPSKSALLKSVRIATVDNFQGEEAKIIVISLVRSNPQKKCGFLSTSNRINVLLSRAQHGMTRLQFNVRYQSGALSQAATTKCESYVMRTSLLPAIDAPLFAVILAPVVTRVATLVSGEVKAVHVDFIEMKSYEEVDLDEDPCIFPDCGHILTVSSMDGQMELASLYEVNEDGHPVKLRGPSKPFSVESSGIAVCANCRGSLRSISRYGRIVRRAMLDEATKKFIAWSSAQYLTLTETVFTEQEKLESVLDTALVLPPTASVLTLPGSRQKLLQDIQGLSGGSKRYGPIIKTWNEISSYKMKVAKEEQPFQRVADLVKHANRQNNATRVFQFDDSVIQIKGYLLATALLLKCESVVLSDFIRLYKKGNYLAQCEVKVDFNSHFQDCMNLINLAQSSMHPREEVQGHIFYAQFCVFRQYLSSSSPKGRAPGTIIMPESAATVEDDDSKANSSNNKLREKGLGHIKQARELLDKYPSTTSVLKNEIDAVEGVLRDGEYRQVTTEELRTIYQALAGELRGTGHCKPDAQSAALRLAGRIINLWQA